MKKLSLILVAASLAVALQSCGGNKDSAEKADSVNKTKDTAVNASVDGDTVKVSPAIEVVAEDAKFAVEAADGGMAEVELGALAQQKATNAQVKDFGAMMTTDHSKANAELKALAKKLNITLPATVSEEQQKIKADLSKKSGADFDKAYASDMVDDHKEDIKKFEDAAKNCKNDELKAFAVKTLPTLKMHLAAIQKINDSLK
jgi:putative membrane protein